MVSATIAFLFSSVQQNCSWNCLCFLSLVLFFPFPLNQTQSDLCLFYSTKFAIGRINNGFHVSRSYGQLSVFILAELSATSFCLVHFLPAALRTLHTWFFSFSPFTPSQLSFLLPPLITVSRLEAPGLSSWSSFLVYLPLALPHLMASTAIYMSIASQFISPALLSLTQDKYTQLPTWNSTTVLY